MGTDLVTCCFPSSFSAFLDMIYLICTLFDQGLPLAHVLRLHFWFYILGAISGPTDGFPEQKVTVLQNPNCYNLELMSESSDSLTMVTF